MPFIIRILTIAVLLALAGGGCDSKSPAEREAEPRRVVATIYPLADVIRAVGGKRVGVQWFVETGQTFDTIPPDAEVRLTMADMVVARGVGDEHALGGADDPERASDIIRVDLLPTSAAGTGYLWLDPVVIKELADVIRQRLTEREPAYAAYFQQNEGAFVRNVDAVVNEYAPRLLAKTNKKAFALTPDFAPLAKRFGIEFVPVLRDAGERLTDEHLRTLRKTASEQGITALFVPADRTPAVQRDLASRTGLEVFTLDPLGSSAPAGRSSYLQILRYNLEQLDRGMK